MYGDSVHSCTVNPFNYQGPVAPPLLIDRREELDALQAAAADRIAVRLAAPRRFGKSSLLEAHMSAMTATGLRAVRVDFSKVATLGDAAARVARAYAELPTDPDRIIRRWAGRLGVTATIGGAGITVAPRTRLPADESRTALLEMLDVPRALYEVDGEPTIVCFDEFQDLLVADDALDGLVRSVVQRHGEVAAYVFAGSQPSLMHALFSDQERPFYGQARPLELPPLPVAEAAQDIEHLFEADGLRPGPAVDQLLEFSGGHPQRTILLAHHLYNLLEGEESTPEPAAAAALELALEETRDAHQTLWDGLSRNERVVVAALSDGQAPTGSIVADEHRIARSTLQDALERLLADQRHVRRDATGRAYLLDPFLGEWLRRR